jgi:hypothetical protein
VALRRGHLDLAEEFEAAGESYAEHGDLVYRSPPAPSD